MKKSILIILITACSFNVLSQVFSTLTSGTSVNLLAIHFTNDNTGYIVGSNGLVKKTINSGTSFTTQTTGTTSTINDIDFMNNDTGFVVGKSGTLLRTFNGGTNWSSVYSGTDNLVRISFNGNIIFCTSENGIILKSTNFGNSWTTISTSATGTTGTIYDIFWTSPLVGYNVGWGYVRKTINGGTTWTSLNVPGVSLTNLLSVHFTDTNNGFVVGGTSGNTGTILRTMDAGLTWTSQLISNNRFTDIQFLNSSVGYIAGGSITSNSSTILKTTNGGNSWFTVSSNSTRQYNLSLPSFNVGYSCGLNGSILKTKGIKMDIMELVNNKKINVFPNPASNKLNFSFENISEKEQNEMKFEIYNIQGELVFKIKNVKSFDVSAISEGVYILKITHNKSIYSKRIIIQ